MSYFATLIGLLLAASVSQAQPLQPTTRRHESVQSRLRDAELYRSIRARYAYPGRFHPSSSATPTSPRILRAPRGPLAIVYLEGTNSLLIRGAAETARLPTRAGDALLAPQGPVQIDVIEELDLLLLRGRSVIRVPDAAERQIELPPAPQKE